MDILVEDRYSFDINTAGAVKALYDLTQQLEFYQKSIAKAEAEGKDFAAQQRELISVEGKMVSILNQEVNTYEGISAKRKIMQEVLRNLTKGTREYSAVAKQVAELEKREINTMTGRAAKIEELKIKLKGLEQGTRDYANALRELNGLEKKASAETAKLTKSSGGFTAAIGGALAGLGIVVGIQQVIQLGEESLKASSEKLQQKNALLSALKNQEQVQENLLAQADNIEARTLVDDDEIIKLDRYAASIGLTEKQIKTLNEASVQYSAVTGKSVRGAADALIAAQNGQIRGIVKLVPEVRNLTKAQLASGAAAELVAKKFAGSAEALTTGVIGAQNKIKDFSEGFKESIGDAITDGLAKNFAVFSKLSIDGAESFLGRLAIAAKKTLSDIVALPGLAVAGVQAVIAGTGAAFDYIGNRLDILLLQTKEKYIQLKAALLLADGDDLRKLEEISNKIAENQIRNAGGFSANVSIAARSAFDESLSGFEDFSKALQKNQEDVNDTPLLPKGKGEIKAISGSLSDLEKQLSDIKEKLSKSVVATDEAALLPLLKQIDELEKRIKAAKKLQDELINGPKPIELDVIKTKDLQEDFLAKETQKARIEEQLIRQTSAERLQAIEEDQARELSAAGVTAEQKKVIEAKYQRERERLAIETERRIVTNALQQKQLELSGIKIKGPEDVLNQERLNAEIADLKAKLAELQNKSIEIEVGFSPAGKAKLDSELKEILDGVVDLANTFSGAISDAFARSEQRAADAVSKQESSLNNALQNSKEFTAEQIEIERDRLEKLDKQQENAAKKAKGFAYAQLALNTVVAVAKAASQTGVGAPVAIIAVLAAIAAGVASALALSDGNAFDEGVDYVPLGNNKPGKDTVPARLTAGEAVLDKEDNRNYHPTVKAIRRHMIPADVLNNFVASYRGGAQMPRSAAVEERAAITNGSSIGSTNYYFSAKLNKLEREAETQTSLLSKIERQGREDGVRTRKRAPDLPRPKRFN